MARVRRSPERQLAIALALLVLATIALAPLMSVGWCRDAPIGGVSECGSDSYSLIGLPSNLWLWLFTVALIVVATALISRRRSRRRDQVDRMS